MINKEIIKIASDTKFEGLKKKFTHKSSAKNSILIKSPHKEFFNEDL